MATQQLVILHATDVHAAFQNIERLKQWLLVAQHRVDVVLLSGDLANCPMEAMATATPGELREQHAILDKVVAEFLTLGKQLYYLPGNHDVISTYTPTDSWNVHMRCVNIAEHLHLVGMGGSVPGFRNGTKCWASFPYNDEAEFSVDLTKSLEPVFNEVALDPRDSVILMTHVGPTESSTTLARADPANPVISGSSTLYNYLCRDTLRRHVLMNVHGHTHDAPGSVRLGATTILNPGALVEERFGLYTLTYNSRQNPAWKLASTQLLSLP